MLTALFSLTGALVYGSADFLGGLAAKRLHAVLVSALAAVGGLLAVAIVAPLFGGTATAADAAWGALSGVVGAVAIALLYASLAIGPMSILSPLTAVISAIVPMLWGVLANGERFGWVGAFALGLALVAVVLVGFVPERGAVRPSTRGLLLGVGSGAAIGGFYVVIAQTSDASGMIPLVFNRATAAVVLFAAFGVIVLARSLRGRSRVAAPEGELTIASVATLAPELEADPVAGSSPAPHAPSARQRSLRIGIALALTCGIVDLSANVLLLLGIRAGDLSVAAVLGALYPAGTIVLAAIVLHERIAPVQWLGLALALTAAALLALA